MMSNERRREASTLLVVAKDNLKQRETKGCHFQNKKPQQNNEYLPEATFPYNGGVGVEHAARTQYTKNRL